MTESIEYTPQGLTDADRAKLAARDLGRQVAREVGAGYGGVDADDTGTRTAAVRFYVSGDNVAAAVLFFDSVRRAESAIIGWENRGHVAAIALRNQGGMWGPFEPREWAAGTSPSVAELATDAESHAAVVAALQAMPTDAFDTAGVVGEVTLSSPVDWIDEAGSAVPVYLTPAEARLILRALRPVFAPNPRADQAALDRAKAASDLYSHISSDFIAADIRL